MNWDTIEGNWKQLKGNVKQQWGKLTDDHIDVIAGKREHLAGKIQEAYGVSKDEAEKQIADFEKRQDKQSSQPYGACTNVRIREDISAANNLNRS